MAGVLTNNKLFGSGCGLIWSAWICLTRQHIRSSYREIKLKLPEYDAGILYCGLFHSTAWLNGLKLKNIRNRFKFLRLTDLRSRVFGMWSHVPPEFLNSKCITLNIISIFGMSIGLHFWKRFASCNSFHCIHRNMQRGKHFYWPGLYMSLYFVWQTARINLIFTKVPHVYLRFLSVTLFYTFPQY